MLVDFPLDSQFFKLVGRKIPKTMQAGMLQVIIINNW